MDSRVNVVSNFFNTQPYLDNTFNIALRESIINELKPKLILGKSVLDIGCGDGSLSLPFLKSNKVVAIDSAKAMLLKAKLKFSQVESNYEPEIIEGDFLSYSFSKKFDLILCIGVVAHIENIELLFSKIYDLLEDDGHAIIQISDADHYRYKNSKSSLQNYGYELNKTGKQEFIKKLINSGFKLKKQSGYSWSFFPISRFSQKGQFFILNKIRKVPVFNFLTSEWLFLVSKVA